MFIKKIPFTCVALFGLGVAGCAQLSIPAAAPGAPTSTVPTLQTDFDRFIKWFGGEWNNNEQVWQQQIDIKTKPTDEKIAHTHHIFAPVVAPKIGKHVYYVQQSLDGDLSKSYRQRVYRMSPDEKENAVKLEIFNLPDDKLYFDAHKKPELFANLEVSQLRATPGCEVYWRYDASTKAFDGTLKPNTCSFVSARFGNKRVIFSDTLKLTESEIWINDQARDEQGGYVFGSKTDTPVKNRKVRYYTGWAYIRHEGPKGDGTNKKFTFQRNITIHNEGQRIPIIYDDGTPSPYMVELAQLTYQNTNLPILKLALIDKDTKKSVTYIWGNTEASRLGMNLTWFQVGVTQKTSRVEYGFDDPLAPKPVAAPAATRTATPVPAPATTK